MRRSVSVLLLTAAGFIASAVLTTAAVGEPVPTTPAWTISPSPNDGTLNAVSCVSASFCTAVGPASAAPQPALESWNGTSWTISSSSHSGTLYGESCVSASFCVAVGDYSNTSGVERTLIETWNGTAWQVSKSANRGTNHNLLNGVSCVSTTSCQAVGTYFNVNVGWQTLAESWNGTTWSIVPSASPGLGVGSNDLLSVSCVSATSCQAVGDYYKPGDTYQTLAESWNGVSWKRVGSPNPNNGSNIDYLEGVSCVSATLCKAVGFYDDAASVAHSLVESWNGTAWRVSKSPDNGTGDNYLYGVSCGSATSCKAVGYYGDGDAEQTLIVSWGGTAWSLSASPNETNASALHGVSCVSATSCKAVGVGNLETLIESYG